jgi:sugar lactone lactonase YvrE
VRKYPHVIYNQLKIHCQRTKQQQQTNIMQSSLLLFIVVAIVATVTLAATPNRITFQSKNLFPEGLEYHQDLNAFLVSSVGNGQVWKVNDKGEVSAFINDTRLDARSSIGLHINHKTNQLLVAVSNSSAAYLGQVEYAKVALVKADLQTGAIQQFIDLTSVSLPDYKGALFANDLVSDENGNTYITESFGGFIWKVDSNNVPSVLVSSPEWTPENQYSPGINGIEYANGTLLVGKQGTGRLFKISLSGATPNVTEITITGAKPVGVDGLLLKPNGNLVIVGRSSEENVKPRIYEFHSSDNWNTTSILYDEEISVAEPTTAAVRGKEVFIVHSYFNDFLTGRDSFDITKAPSPISDESASVSVSAIPSTSTETSGSSRTIVNILMIALILVVSQLL